MKRESVWKDSTILKKATTIISVSYTHLDVYKRQEQALITLNKELGKDKNLEVTKARGQKTWNEVLNRIVVEGCTDEQMKTFYSCLFRANLFSRKFCERKENGEPYYYSPYNGKIYDGYMYTDNGFWDTFRSQFPLTNILHPTMQGRYMNALLAAQEDVYKRQVQYECNR